jgi:formate hydrogenlyase subunit 6/NADH:ubiquinone oxidoreductase subunit I
MFEAGPEGLWTPIMNFRIGHCQLNCTACGQVCPTGAIQRLTIEQKLGLKPHEKEGPVKLGTAHYDLGRCLPWSKNIPCVVCEEVCPTSPKAIHSEYRQFLVRDGKKQIAAATPVSVTLSDYPNPGQPFGEPCTFRTNDYRGDRTTSYYVQIIHRDGIIETHAILGNDADTLLIGELDPASGEVVNGSKFAKTPTRGELAAVNLEFKVPKIDTELCIGCGLCEKECPVVGDRRAVYVTAEGETRSQNYLERERNRSLRLMKASADASSDRNAGAAYSLTGMIAATNRPKPTASGCCGGKSSSTACACHSGAPTRLDREATGSRDAADLLGIRKYLL